MREDSDAGDMTPMRESADLPMEDYAQPVLARRVSPLGGAPSGPAQGDVHVSLGQSFLPREPTYERIKLMWYGLIVHKFNEFGHRHYGYRDAPYHYRHMRSETLAYMMTVASQVPRSLWPKVRESVKAFWLDLDQNHDRQWHIPLAMAEIENIMFETGLGLIRKPKGTRCDIGGDEINALWAKRLKTDRERGIFDQLMNQAGVDIATAKRIHAEWRQSGQVIRTLELQVAALEKRLTERSVVEVTR